MRFLGVPVEFRASVSSTNDEILRRAAEGAPEGLVIAADQQTAGRGRQGRSWWDAPGNSLLFSVLLRPSIPLARFPLLGIAMACAVAEAGSEAAGEPLSVKWPNDVLHVGRKLCGVLAEARPGGAAGGPGGPGHVLAIGTGINVNQRAGEFPDELRDRATSLREAAGGRVLDRRAILADLLARFDAYRRLAVRDGADALRLALLPRLPAAGSPIVVQTADRRVEGTVEEILETGALLVRDRAGARVPVVAGEIPFGSGEPA
ncbi:MAG TPA: biotin--[acetyl-CoA-carboxylase] ligase [Candidatus Limnocylindrales bacterium]|nr:biotin--[acetyl-CoA-carboxylase] ligase [Candidatus Limnocylindrales bacterium]